MCNVCWVNDHMYCRNMKRIARELPSFSGCIHYIACEHYRQPSMSAKTAHHSHIDSHGMSVHWTNQRTGGKILPSHRVVSVEDLLCDEEMLDSETDVSDNSVDGTELLQVRLKARAEQILHSLGVSELPKTKPQQSVESTVAAKDNDVVITHDDDPVITPEEYAAEVIINADGDSVTDVTEIHQLSEVPVETFTASRQDGETVVRSESRWCRTCSQESGHRIPCSTHSLASFDGTSPAEPPVNVTVHVLPVTDSRVVIKYPKYSSSPTEYVRLDVTFPNGATDEVVNSYVKNDVARFICEKKSDFTSEVPISVTVVTDSTSLQTTDEGDTVSVVESRHNGLQSPATMVSNKSIPVKHNSVFTNMYDKCTLMLPHSFLFFLVTCIDYLYSLLLL